MSWVTIIMDPNHNKVKIDWFYPKKIVFGTIRGDQFLYIFLEFGYKHNSRCYNVFLLILRPLFLRVFFLFYIIFLLSSLPSTGRLDFWCWSLSHQHLAEVFASSCKVENYCSGITFLCPVLSWCMVMDGRPHFLTSASLSRGSIPPRTTFLDHHDQTPFFIQ